jgi:CRP-like cAMP-binding protein
MTRREVSLLPNRQIVGEGEIGLDLFMLTEGWAFRYRQVGERGRQIVDFLLPGEIIGLQASLLGVLEHSMRSLTSVRLKSYDPRLIAEAFDRWLAPDRPASARWPAHRTKTSSTTVPARLPASKAGICPARSN